MLKVILQASAAVDTVEAVDWDDDSGGGGSGGLGR